jgi:hypothetical protein
MQKPNAIVKRAKQKLDGCLRLAWRLWEVGISGTRVCPWVSLQVQPGLPVVIMTVLPQEVLLLIGRCPYMNFDGLATWMEATWRNPTASLDR